MVTTRNSVYQQPKRQPKRQILPRNSTVESEKEKRSDLQEVYENIRSTPNFSAKITQFLRENKNHSVHRRIVKNKFPRRRIITESPFQIFQADLIEYRDYGYSNGGNRFILVVIDCFSKMLYAEPVKRKNADYMSMAFKKIFEKLNFFPNSIITDRGLEFYNSQVHKIFDH